MQSPAANWHQVKHKGLSSLSSKWHQTRTPRTPKSTTSTARTCTPEEPRRRRTRRTRVQRVHKLNSTSGEMKSATSTANPGSKHAPHNQSGNTHPQMSSTQCAHWKKHHNPKQKKSKTYWKSAQTYKNEEEVQWAFAFWPFKRLLGIRILALLASAGHSYSGPLASRINP